MTAYDTHLGDIATLLFDRGGWTLIALALLSLIMFTAFFVSLLRFASLKPFSSKEGAVQAFTQHIQQHIAAGLSKQQIEDDAMIMARGYLRSARTGFRLLELTVTTAPLLGLLGTVLGMIEAFQAMQTAGNTIKPADLAGGIWEALITTAAGMIIALIALILHSILDALVERFKFRLEETATATLIKNDLANEPPPRAS